MPDQISLPEHFSPRPKLPEHFILQPTKVLKSENSLIAASSRHVDQSVARSGIQIRGGIGSD
jgi:hypothetical protein